MLKITKSHEDDQSVTLRLDGSIGDATASDLERLCLYYKDKEKKMVVLDFSGVTFINSNGLKTLEKIKDSRIRMVKGSLFIETLLSDLKR